MVPTRYFTKSRFKLATECPTKLFYTGKDSYANQKLEDSFLEALAEGGFQVGELAKYYFPNGQEITTLNHSIALKETHDLLRKEQVVIYEAAIASGHLFIRADILVKQGDTLHLYEVKAKSFDAGKEGDFTNKNGTLKSSWKPYLMDVAFQKHVVQKAFPSHKVQAYLVMADKNAICPTDGLNQKFRIVKNEQGRKSISVSMPIEEADLNPPLLCMVNVEEACSKIYSDQYALADREMSFVEMVDYLAEHYANDQKIVSPISVACGSCEFQTQSEDARSGLKSGRDECWREKLKWEEDDFKQLTVLDVWNFRRKQQLIQEGRMKMSDIREEDIAPLHDNKPGLSNSQRQWMQVEKYQTSDSTAWFDYHALKHEIDNWKYPLHFIDFETTMVAIPFNKGRRPYEGVAFQFSHHVVYEDGSIVHYGEYLNTQKGVFPNYAFVRELKQQLSHDEGSIFRYSSHENTILNLIYRQLQADESPISDREALCAFIQEISHSVSDSAVQWSGARRMIDMWEIVKRFYYDPATKGSNSIKHVLPAMLNSSAYLKEKYSKPIYGAPNGIKSHNFKDWQWIEVENGLVKDPYKLLPPLFQSIEGKDYKLLSENVQLKDGGAALIAYARMQFEEMTPYEREELRQALLRYCELDTLAMVMLYEGWKQMVKDVESNW